MQTGELTHGAAPDVVAELVSLAWSTFVGCELAPTDEVNHGERVMCSSISIHGPWSATFLLYCDTEVATASAASVLGMDPSEIESADVRDIMGELANIIGGNLKGAVSDDHTSWKLSLPVVSDGMQTVPGSKLTLELGFVGPWGSIGCQVHEHA
ncbi:MAG: chemotaxis protein CheX [Acidimicrobiales bacterium]|nr:chemotaxis protein CheX [Acidimicrobiales bacterium]MCB9392783.1 chemotaxis protein CheX [Acidimicrobiaceae bacterium]